jgi:hypothetical protein
MVLDDSIDHGQAQTRTPAHLAGGEERFEDPLFGVLILPMPVSVIDTLTYWPGFM